jgi:glucose/arabinose dehydrogenase
MANFLRFCSHMNGIVLCVSMMLPYMIACEPGARSDRREEDTLYANANTSEFAQGGDQFSRDTAPIEKRLTAPEGMKATVFADDIDGARFMVLGPDGAVYVSQPRRNRIMRLFDADGDGIAESRTVAVSGLDRPHGMAFHKGYFYIANTGGVVRVKLDAQGKAIGTPEELNRYSSGGGHWTRTLIFGADGKMYVSIGSSCNICEERSEDRAAVMQYDENGKNGRLYARGLRNAVGIAVNPVTKEIWAVVNERDNLKPDHEDLPPERLDILKDGGDYGWPYCWGDRVPNPEFNDKQRCASTIPPAFKIPAHTAPLGLTFLQNATQLPKEMRSDVLVALHGSWNRTVPAGAKVIRIHVENNKPVRASDFVTGWQLENGSRWGRPVDVLVYKDGSILISDDQGGKIFRVSQTKSP